MIVFYKLVKTDSICCIPYHMIKVSFFGHEITKLIEMHCMWGLNLGVRQFLLNHVIFYGQVFQDF